MKPDNLNLNFGGGVADTIVSPIALGLVILAGILVIFSPRGRALAAFVAAGIWIPTNQIVVIAGVHFPMLRLLALFGFVRIFWRKLTKGEQVFSGGVNAIDKALIILTVSTALDGVLLWRQTAEFVYQLGVLLTTFGVYFLLRHLLRTEADIKEAIRTLAYVAIPIAALMVYEASTGHNPYYEFLGGARAAMLSSAVERGEKFRATGVFAHPIIAGTFGGIIAPLFLGWWRKERRDRKLAGCGLAASLVIASSTGSSTALFALLGGIVAFCFWPLRGAMKLVRRGLVIVLIGLHIVMKGPVWSIIAHLDLTGSSSSDHRYQLVNQCILHFWDWVLVGTKNYGSWGWDMFDLSNQYVGIADTSGLIPLIAFVAILVFCFKYIGKARRFYRDDGVQERFVWAIGASLFANVVAFAGIAYWDQIIVAWYTLLAIICTVTLPARQKVAEPAVEMATGVDIQRPALAPILIRSKRKWEWNHGKQQ